MAPKQKWQHIYTLLYSEQNLDLHMSAIKLKHIFNLLIFKYVSTSKGKMFLSRYCKVGSGTLLTKEI